MAEQVNIASEEFIGANSNALRQCFTELGIDAEVNPENVKNAVCALGDKFTECLQGWIDQEAGFDGKNTADTIKSVATALKQEPEQKPTRIMGINPIMFYGLLITLILLVTYFIYRARTHTAA